MISKKQLFGDLVLNSILDNPDFKEDSKTLHDPFLKVGSNKKIAIKLIPDYCLKVENNFAWVLDAKSPNQRITDEDHIAQVYSYSYHSEIRSTYFALCNGLEFILFRVQATNEPILQFYIDEIEHHWEKLAMYLSPGSFQIGKNITYDNNSVTSKQSSKFDYITRPLLEEIEVKKRSKRRHFGVHGYFTKQSWNVVADYIKNAIAHK